MVSARGWLSDSQTDYLSLAEKMDLAGSGWIVFTDISKDGMMEGPNLSQLSQLRKRVSCRLTASGGIRSLEDLKALDATNIEAAIPGKGAVYRCNRSDRSHPLGGSAAGRIKQEREELAGAGKTDYPLSGCAKRHGGQGSQF